MSENNPASLSSVFPLREAVRNRSEKLRLKDLRERLELIPLEFSNDAMVVRYSEDSYLFVYNYGSVVFFNVSDELQKA